MLFCIVFKTLSGGRIHNSKSALYRITVRIEVSANFTFENKKYRYDTKVYDNAECILNYENLANDVRCKLVYVRIRSKNFNIGCKAEIFL